MSKTNHMKKVIEDLNVFKKYFRVRQEFSDKIQTIIYFIKGEIQTSIENNISCKKGKEKLFCLNGDGLKKIAYYESCSSPRWGNLPSGHQRYSLKGINLGYMYWGENFSSE